MAGRLHEAPRHGKGGKGGGDGQQNPAKHRGGGGAQAPAAQGGAGGGGGQIPRKQGGGPGGPGGLGGPGSHTDEGQCPLGSVRLEANPSDFRTIPAGMWPCQVSRGVPKMR